MDPESFWHITPREMVARIEGAHRRVSAEQDGRAWLAWTTAALMRQQKLPELSSLMARDEPQAPQTPAEQEISLDMLFLAWGGDPAELAQMREQKGAD
ncbi:hypothetical protein [Leisingera sp. HS039]|uniref:hypothetical protein n=1 Tax=Leisingera sp. HS039 TaxID=2818496 RepID=UPI001B3A3D14|nr:hypothetical protein [Leisingera sp. HS039]